MNIAELSKAYEIGRSDEPIDPKKEPIDVFDGFALNDFRPVHVTLKQVARLIRWQAIRWDGSLDSENFQEIADFGRKRFLII